MPSKQQGFAICPHPKHGQKQLNYYQKVCRYRRSKDGNQQKIPRKPLISIFFWVAHPSATLKKNHKPHPLGVTHHFGEEPNPPNQKKPAHPKPKNAAPVMSPPLFKFFASAQFGRSHPVTTSIQVFKFIRCGFFPAPSGPNRVEVCANLHPPLNASSFQWEEAMALFGHRASRSMAGICGEANFQ